MAVPDSASDVWTPSVSVVISHLNSARTLKECLAHILSQNYPMGKFEIILVDAGSTDGSIEIAAGFPEQDVRLFVRPGISESEGQDFGARQSKSEVIMFTNSDIYVPRDWIRRHTSWLGAGYDIVGGKVFWGGDKYSLTWNMPTPKKAVHVQQQGLGLGFSNCSLRRSLYISVGGVRPLKSQQDTDFVFRIACAGGRMLLDPKIEVYHDHPFRSAWLSFQRSAGYGRNHVLVMKSVYGRIVTGSGHPAMLSLMSVLREWTGINAVKTYGEIRENPYAESVEVGLFEFIFLRLFSTRVGQYVGVLSGIMRRNPTASTIVDLHKQIEKYYQPALNPAKN